MIYLSPKIFKINFYRCKFEKTRDHDLKHCNLPTIQTHVTDLRLMESDIPVVTLKFLLQRNSGVNTLIIDHHDTSNSVHDMELRFYRDLLDLISFPLPSLQKLHIMIGPETHIREKDICLDDNQPCPLEGMIKEKAKYVGNLPNVIDVRVAWNVASGQAFCPIIFACLRGNECLERFVLNFDFKGGLTDMMGQVLSLSYPKLKFLSLTECSKLFVDRERAPGIVKKMGENFPRSSTKESTGFQLPSISMLTIDAMLLVTEPEIGALFRGIDGSHTLLSLSVNNLSLPFMASILQSKGLQELTQLQIEYLWDTSNESQDDTKFREDADVVCCLPKLKNLEFKKLHGLVVLHQNILKQFFVSVRSSHSLTVLDISGH